MDLPSEQARIYELLGGFLRVDRSDDALWISDYPRREDHPDAMRQTLRAMGLACMMDERSGLWHLDWTEEKWIELLNSLPDTLPPYPRDEGLHEIYAFCRFALLHPAKSSPESLRYARAVLKGTAQISRMHEQCVEDYRNGRSTAWDAGRILAAMIREKERER